MLQYLKDNWQDILFLLLILLLLMLLFWWLLSRPVNSGQRSHGDGNGGDSGDEAGDGTDSEPTVDSSRMQRMFDEAREAQAAREKQRQEHELRERAPLIKEILQGDPEVGALMIQMASAGPTSPQAAARDDDVIRRIAQVVTLPELTILRHAARPNAQLDAIELKRTSTIEAVPYPTDDSRIEPMISDSELGMVVSDEMAADDAVFYGLLSEGTLNVTRHYEQTKRVRRVYLLIDISPSMREYLNDGTHRIQWAAGVALKLMLRAASGEAEYMIRFFDGNVSELYMVETPEQAEEMRKLLLRLQANGDSTDIGRALGAAMRDIAGLDSDADTSDVLLISDGESTIDEDWLRQTFGRDTRLHLALIGLENPLLEEVATSSEIYR